MRPGESVTLLACVANHNPESKRDVQLGDAFAFEFADGALGPCGAITTISPLSALTPSDFDCAIDGHVMRLTHVSAAAEWPALDAVCVRLPYSVPAAPTRVATSMTVGNVGAFRAPSPTMLLLNIDADLGSVGPTGATGPVGPAGPAGATGASGIGAAIMVVSTGYTLAQQNTPPELVPGLDVELTISEGSKIEVLVDAVSYPCRFGAVDGGVIARRSQQSATNPGSSGVYSEGYYTMAWLSSPLAAGPHRVRFLIDVAEPDPRAFGFSRCVGTRVDDLDDARLIVKEIRSAP